MPPSEIGGWTVMSAGEFLSSLRPFSSPSSCLTDARRHKLLVRTRTPSSVWDPSVWVHELFNHVAMKKTRDEAAAMTRQEDRFYYTVHS